MHDAITTSHESAALNQTLPAVWHWMLRLGTNAGTESVRFGDDCFLPQARHGVQRATLCKLMHMILDAKIYGRENAGPALPERAPHQNSTKEM